MFIGYPRSGHSLIGQLLNAHPEALVAHQFGAAEYLQAGFNRRQIFAMLNRRDRSFARSNYVQDETNYDYSVPGGSQGLTRRPRVIGDKSGAQLSWAMDRDPALMEKLHDALGGYPLKVINHVRSPYDSIATDSIREDRTVPHAVVRYRRLATAVDKAFKALAPEEKKIIYHEDFVGDPRASLSELCSFLDLDASPDYLDSCAAVVFDSPKKSRHRVEWSKDDIRAVQDLCREFDVFRPYVDDAP
ncbi:MAG: sulfotransferase [Alphaproteobacteria bacterium]